MLPKIALIAFALGILTFTTYRAADAYYYNYWQSITSTSTSTTITYSTSTKSPSPTPTRTPSATPTKRPSPTPSVRPTNMPTPTILGACDQNCKVPNEVRVLTPTTGTSTAPTSDKLTYLINAINDYRRSKGLSEVKTDSYTCDFAKTRAREITSAFNHDGFRNRIDSKSLPYPSYSKVTENIAMTSDYTKVVPMWINSSGHAENMRADTPLVCVAWEGNYYAYEGWRP